MQKIVRSPQRNADDQPIPPNKRAAMRACGATSGYACKMQFQHSLNCERAGKASARIANGRKNSALQKIRNAASLLERAKSEV